VQHEIGLFFEQLTDDQMQTLSKILTGALTGGDTALNYYRGLLSGLLHAKGVCIGCGERHDFEHFGLAADAQEPA
jgi:hypothetical protein